MQLQPRFRPYMERERLHELLGLHLPARIYSWLERQRSDHWTAATKDNWRRRSRCIVCKVNDQSRIAWISEIKQDRTKATAGDMHGLHRAP